MADIEDKEARTTGDTELRRKILEQERRQGRLLMLGGVLLTVVGLVAAAFGIRYIANSGARPTLGILLSLPIGFGILLALRGLRATRGHLRYEDPDWLQTVDLTSNAQKYRLQATSGGKYTTWVLDGNRLYDHSGQAFDLNTIVGGTTSETNGQGSWLGTTKLKFPEGTTKISAFDAEDDGPNQRRYWEIVGQAEKALRHRQPGTKFGRTWTDKILSGFILACMAFVAVIVIGIGLLLALG